MYGGANSEETFGDLFRLDVESARWSRLQAPLSEATSGPGRRTNHAVVADVRGRIYVFGGYGADGVFFNDLWILKVSTTHAALEGDSDSSSGAANRTADVASLVAWERPLQRGPVPAAREGHSLTLVGRKLVLFGGYTSGGRTAGDVHAFDIDSQDWVRLQIVGALPPPRQAHSAARHGQEVVIAGGCDVSSEHPRCFNDVWSFSIAELRWTQRSSGSSSFRPREGHSATFLRGEMLTFGGCQLGSECYDDVAVLETHDPCPAACGGHGICVSAQFCQCTTPGFFGHDCMQPLTCQEDCGEHGSCSQDGHCTCESGWSGPACATEVPCPGSPEKCSGHGICLASGLCRCSSGFSGPDCAMRVCPQNCSGHGVCGLDSRCACQQGWAGEACSTRLVVLKERCPHGCCGHGLCAAHGCECDSGWHGPLCNANTTVWMAALSHRRADLLEEARTKRQKAEQLRLLAEVLASSTSERSAAATPGATQPDLARLRQLPSEVRSLLAEALEAEQQAAEVGQGNSTAVPPIAVGASCSTTAAAWLHAASYSLAALSEGVVEPITVAGPSFRYMAEQGLSAVGLGSDASMRKSSRSAGAPVEMRPDIKHFGIWRLNDGASVARPVACPESCNFRGICREGVCFCQPGYCGESCDIRYSADKSSVSLGLLFSIAGIVLVSCFLISAVVHYVQHKAMRKKEVQIGYQV